MADATINESTSRAGFKTRSDNTTPTFPEVNAAVLRQLSQLLREWLPDGEREGNEWVSLNPTRADNSPGSFKVNLTSGKWSDFAASDKGGDPVSLFAYLNGLGQGEAAKELARRLGLNGSKPATAKQSKPAWTPILPVPEGVPSPPATHPELGSPVAAWTYRDTEGRALCHIYRFNLLEGGKEFRPLTYCKAAGRFAWRWQAPPQPRPLYNLNRLARVDPALPVVVCEGEKAADAAAKLFLEYACTTPLMVRNHQARLIGRRLRVAPCGYGRTMTPLANSSLVTSPDCCNPWAPQ